MFLVAGASTMLAQSLPPFGELEAPVKILWEIGKPDNDDHEFALAPNRYTEFRDDGFFAVGRSDPARDWPYVQPGPADAWAGSRRHTFTILFGLKQKPLLGDCLLHFDLLDTQGQVPPALTVAVNGRGLNYRMPRGAGDDSIFGQPAKGREHKFDFMFPAEVMREGANEITITTLSGSWILYDWIGLDAPEWLELSEVSGTVVSSLESPPVLVEQNGQLMQTVQVSLRHFGDDTQAVVILEGLGATNLTLRAGANQFDLAVPAVQKETSIPVVVEVAGKVLAEQKLTLKPVRKWVVYLLPHSHVDIGYTHVQTDVEKAQWKYLETGIDIARKTANYPPGSRFKWNVEVLWAVDSYLKQATPEKRQAFIDAVKSGMVGLDALYGNMLTGLCSQEEQLHLMRCAQNVSRLTGVPIVSAMITDVPGYSWGMVPAFAQNGVKYFSVGPNGGDRIGNTSKAWGDKPFWWLGPNPQDKVLLWMTGTGYYRVFSSPQNLLNYLGKLADNGYPYDYVQVRHCLGDNGAPDVNFADTVRQWNEKYAYPKLVIATTAEMFRDFEKRYGDKLPTARGDFTPYWEDGAGSSARETAMNRASADRLLQAETLFAMFNPKVYPADDFYQAWRNVILYDEHTWGAHNSISQPDHPFVKSQWAIKQAFALDADRQSRHLLAAASNARGSAPELPGKVQAIEVVNTTAFSVPWGLVVVPKELSTAGDAVGISPTNTGTIRAQRLTTGELVFRPCLGQYRSTRFYLGPGKFQGPNFEGAQVDENLLTTPRSAINQGLKLLVDEQSGAIASLVYDGHELVDPNSPTALNDYFYLPGSDLKGLQRNGPVKISAKERGPLVASLLVESEAPGCRKLTREIRVHALQNYVEIINTVDKLPVRTKEGVHFGFGFKVPDGTVRLDVPWGVVRPEADQIAGACRNWFTVQRWVDISSKDFGVTWVTPDAPLLEIGGITANLIGGLSGSPLWLEHLDPSPTIYSWAMNNHWHTNYRAEQDGPTVFRYFIFPHANGYDEVQATRNATECRQPFLVMPARGDSPRATQPPFQVSTPNWHAQITAFKPSEDGKAWIVRLLSLSDKAEPTKLTWSQPEPKAVWLSDNSEQPLQPAGNPIELPPHGIVTLRADLP